jgi:Family of unknown function (DUF5677)
MQTPCHRVVAAIGRYSGEPTAFEVKMGRLSSPPTGPYAKWISGFLEISDRAFDLLRSVPRPEIDLDLGWPSVAKRVIFDLTLHAETTSIAARTAISYNLDVPAYALGRVRLEQCIVASFLIHAREEDGIKPYLDHQPIQLYDLVRKHEAHFKAGRDLKFLREQANEAQERLSQGEFLQGKFMRTWTPLRLYELAERRDDLAPAALPWKLEDAYWSFYPLASLAVHGASEATLWAGQSHEPSFGPGECYLYFPPPYARYVARIIAEVDLVQCYEALTYLDSADATELAGLLGRYEKELQRDA